MHNKFNKLIDDVSSLFISRGSEIRIAVAAIVAEEHCCYIGDPGIAKSALIEEIVKRISPVDYFWTQLFGETPPTDVFGQVSLRALKDHDINKRNVKGHLPDAHIAFLDEIFQARSSILVGCNSIMQEGKYMNGCEKVDVPLISMFGASNFFPDDPQLVALWDRFLIRRQVKRLESNADVMKMLYLKDPPVKPKPIVSLKDIHAAHKLVKAVKVNESTISSYMGLLNKLLSLPTPIIVSDRRKKKGLKMLKVNAFLSGRDEISVSDISILRDVLWSNPEDISIINSLIKDYAPADLSAIDAILKSAKSITATLVSYTNKNKKDGESLSAEAIKQITHTASKLTDSHLELKALGGSNVPDSVISHNGKEVNVLDYFTNAESEMKNMRKKVASIMNSDIDD